MQRNKHTFRPNSFLGSIDQESWNVLSAHWKTHTYQSGQFLISADDDHTDIFFILSGAAKVTNYTPAGREVSFASVAAGDSFGEYAAIDNAPRSSSVVASGACIAACISSEQFRNLLLTYSDISFALHKVMVSQLRKLSKRVIDFNAKSADMRLKETLLELAQTHALGKRQRNPLVDGMVQSKCPYFDLTSGLFYTDYDFALLGKIAKQFTLFFKYCSSASFGLNGSPHHSNNSSYSGCFLLVITSRKYS